MNPLARTIAGLALLPLSAFAARIDDDNARLRAEVEQLKAQLEAARASCSTAGTASMPANAAAAPAAAIATPPAAAASSTAPAAAVAATPPVPPAEIPSGYKLVKIEPVIPVDNRWKDPNAWDALFRGMEKDQVENLLGVEHSVTEGGNRTFWGYGKVGVQFSGKVIFVDNRLAVWTKPDF